jgi:hypothetical protein
LTFGRKSASYAPGKTRRSVTAVPLQQATFPGRISSVRLLLLRCEQAGHI